MFAHNAKIHITCMTILVVFWIACQIKDIILLVIQIVISIAKVNKKNLIFFSIKSDI